MQEIDTYRNLSGDGGIKGFRILKDGIIILYNKGYMYLYDHVKPGKQHVDMMKKLAKEGKGLKTYINKNVRGNYRKKLPEALN